ncbi:hypothetical protein [Microcystis sp. LE19-195.1E]|uniref:hypothetical protein n=1 Tax=Microcystis sp. LE19-195.1E TaxID=3016440 RepID=UPI0022BAAE6F|nr:hypothetical protein [Microcystis sp. LE19-195.1E]MCZ8248972.1 hypothetical protein [Microcystis sp. LE19-195.1E]
MLKKFFLGAGCGVQGFTHFQVVNYLIFREKVPDTKSVEYRLVMRRGTHARGTHAKGRINNQFLITGFIVRQWLRHRTNCH